jgi:N,N'-diacetyllegionaminate synthase
MRAVTDIWTDQGHCYVIAEVGMAHDGSLGLAHAFVDAVATTGADAIKFQTHIAEKESARNEPFRVPGIFVQDSTRFGYWQRTAFTAEQWRELARHCEQRGLVFLSSPFSIEAADLLDGVGVTAWKIASGEMNNVPLLSRLSETRKPALLSSGMSSFEELDSAVSIFQSHKSPIAIFQCTTAYPCAPESIGLNLIPVMRERYGCPVGLSDHSGTIFAGLAAAMLGSRMLEVHVTMSRHMFGPDVPASVTIQELGELVRGLKFLHRAMTNPVDKSAMAKDMEPLRKIFNKSLVAARHLDKGAVLTSADIAFRKPGTGLPTSRLAEILGRTLVRDVAAETQFSIDDFK